MRYTVIRKDIGAVQRGPFAVKRIAQETAKQLATKYPDQTYAVIDATGRMRFEARMETAAYPKRLPK